MRSIVVLAWMLPAVACTGAAPATAPASPPTEASTSTVDDYPDLSLRRFRIAMNEPRPVDGSAMPPRHLDADRFPDTLVERTEIVAGGPPPDGIPSIDAPTFAPVREVDDLEPDEAVLLLEIGDVARIYPVRVMIWHEIVNDVVDGTAITVTYCPLCNSAVAYDRRLDDRVLEFGTSGYLFRSALVMYDRQTESLWTHFDGRAVVGMLLGAQLDLIPVSTVSWKTAAVAHPDALVLRGDPSNPKPYGENPYVGYDQRAAPLSGWFDADVPEPIPLMARVVGVRSGDARLAVTLDRLAAEGVVAAAVGDEQVVVFHRSGLASPLRHRRIADGDDIGETGVFSSVVGGRRLTFRFVDGRFVDVDTNSTWTITGRAIAGPLVGTELVALEHLDTFWFAWVGHHPETLLLANR